MKTTHKIYIGNSRQMKEVSDQSVSCVITSPPYVTTLMKKGQKFDYTAYRDMIKDVFKEIWRVLIPDGRFCLNVADIRTKYFYENGNGLYRVPISADLLMLCQDLGFLLFASIETSADLFWAPIRIQRQSTTTFILNIYLY